MEMSTSNATQAAAAQVAKAPATGGLQIGMLKRALDAQKQQSDQLLKMLEGKGNTIDIRV